MSDIPERLAAAVSGRYVVEREIGAGGMATVYLARDLRHKRPVALKVIRPELGGREGVERFLREIELAAGLQHPHILPVFDSGMIEDGGGSPIPYFVMPFVEGETLRQLLRREGRLPVETARTIATEVADALAYAHGKGVVHRDIKPENVLLSGGHAVVLDFGVAKAVAEGTASTAAGGSTRLTRAGMVMGTPHYMSPEQATAEAVVDARSDQYGLGCVLYEMLTGQPPFAGSTAQTILAQSLTAARPHPGHVRAEVPPELDHVVVRALALDPADRYPDMSSLRSALSDARGRPGRRVRNRWVGAGALAVLAGVLAGSWFAGRSRPSIAPAAETLAVLPFHTSGPGIEFLGEGMVDLLATNLRGVGGINTVDPRTVVRQWGSARPGMSDLSHALNVGRKLDAGSVVLGSAVSTGGRVRLAADIYSVDGKRLGQAQVDGAADSVLSVVDRLSLALLRDVWRSREPLPNLRLASLTTDSIAALREYLRGEGHYRKLQWDSAQGAYTRAVEIDSTFALAHMRRAQVFGWTGGYGNPESRTALAAAGRFAGRLPTRDRRLLAGYQLFDTGNPASVDSLRAYAMTHPDDVEGWFLLGEARFHTHIFRPDAPDSTYAPFDSVISRDSTLYPALIHPFEVALLTRDSARFSRYYASIATTAPATTLSALRTSAQFAWGPEPSDSALRAVLIRDPAWIIYAANSAYRLDNGTSDSVLSRFNRIQRLSSQSPTFQGGVAARFKARGLAARSQALAGLGRWRRARLVVDSLKSLDPGTATEIVAWATALGLAPSVTAGFLDSAVASFPSGHEAEYAKSMVELIHGRTAQGRRRIARTLAAPDSAAIPTIVRGYLIAADGWGAVMQGDTLNGLRRLRTGVDMVAAPGESDDSAFLRLQLAITLASRPETREEGITWLRNGFDIDLLYQPLTYLALGRTYEAAGKPDSAALSYRRFLRLWDKADPELQGRVREARSALADITRER